MTFEPGDLVLIPFPFADLSTAKKRPVLVLTGPDRHGDFIALAITSVRQEEAALSIAGDSLIEGESPRVSWVRMDKIFTLSSTSVIRRFARVQPELLEKVLTGVCTKMGYCQRVLENEGFTSARGRAAPGSTPAAALTALSRRPGDCAPAGAGWWW